MPAGTQELKVSPPGLLHVRGGAAGVAMCGWVVMTGNTACPGTQVSSQPLTNTDPSFQALPPSWQLTRQLHHRGRGGEHPALQLRQQAGRKVVHHDFGVIVQLLVVACSEGGCWVLGFGA